MNTRYFQNQLARLAAKRNGYLIVSNRFFHPLPAVVAMPIGLLAVPARGARPDWSA